ncbi:hypothetical protein BATDEDRAFT_35132 [Batrachochytrium dendrobatidis JAM81]|uniref:Uncharacterized protein n=1 Tax=Batrachochytrium dendrobatidis (strain JAM81 / FGSC 10211) TaxID=684364 RepID=F4P2K8_BATDJ|nr:uncharacterized protein BATDEDRAFT_35132 [Batrachochytrium dendrobatidis JAM81]EGF80227.1 hypothetical protein BATDEDRAFT_35132 [Batrachochytrium dendrobatidis JAM81]|eukprot:XP_006679116.1 hypothetical protein BATDEDRAFT_35132 [Batrachochytrium dendrobatidis JAM81]
MHAHTGENTSDTGIITNNNSNDSLTSLPTGSATTSTGSLIAATTSTYSLLSDASATSLPLSEDTASDASQSSLHSSTPLSVSSARLNPKQRPYGSNVRFNLPRHDPRESLERQIQLLQLTNQELVAANEACTQSYESKIKELNNTIVNCQSQITLGNSVALAKSQEIDHLYDQLQKAMSPKANQENTSWTDSSINDSLITSKLNVELLQKNAQLRDQLHEAQQKVNQFESFGYQSTKTTVGSTTNQKKPALATRTVFLEKRTQTDQPTYASDQAMADQEKTMCELLGERQWLLKSLTIAQEKNKTLDKNLKQLSSTTQELELKFSTLMGETEVAMATERISRDTIQEQKETISRYSDQVLELAKQVDAYRDQVDRLHDEHQQYKRAQSVIHHMSQVHVHHLKASLKDLDNNTICEENNRVKPLDGSRYGQPSMDPITTVEIQWLADRKKYEEEKKMLQHTIQSLERENSLIQQKLAETLSNTYNETEWTLMYAKFTILQDECNKANSKVESQNCIIEALKNQLGELESTSETHQKVAKTFKDRIAVFKNNLSSRDKSLKDALSKLAEYEKQISDQKAKTKQISLLQVHKDAIIKDLKLKLDSQSSIQDTTKAISSAEQTVLDEIKACRQEITRKSLIIQSLKIRVQALEKELASLKDSTKDLAGSKSCDTLNSQLRSARQRVKESEAYIEKYGNRNQQLMETLERLVTYMHKHKPSATVDLFSGRAATHLSNVETLSVDGNATINCDPDEVLRAAREISKKFFEMDLSQMLTNSSPELESNSLTRLHQILLQSEFKEDLFSYFADLVQMYI